jgi:hypothetical protein
VILRAIALRLGVGGNANPNSYWQMFRKCRGSFHGEGIVAVADNIARIM